MAESKLLPHRQPDDPGDDTLESIGGEFSDKARNCMMIVRQLESDSAGIKAEIDRLKSKLNNVISTAEETIQEAREQHVLYHS